MSAGVRGNVDISTLSNRIDLALHEAASEVMNGCAPLLPRLSWTVSKRRVSGMVPLRYLESEVADILSRWAAEFGLTRDDEMDGTVEYAGTIGDQPVRIWGVVDQAAYDARTASLMGG